MNYLLRIQNLSFIVLIIVVTSCKGQPQTAQHNKIVVQQPSFTSKHTKLTKTQGTDVHQNIHCSLQDKDGNIWFGTTGEGVYRYNGKEFIQYTENDGLSNNKVWCILEDKSGNIWFGTDNGLSKYDGKTISNIPLTITSFNRPGLIIPQYGNNTVWSMMQDRNGIIWLGTSNDLYCYDGKSFNRFLDKTHIANNQNLQLKGIQCFLEDSNGTIWIGSGPGTEEGVVRYDGQSITSVKPNNDGWIRYIQADKNGDVWFSGRHNGVFRYDGKTFRRFTEKENIGSAIFKDKTGNIWFDGGEKINTTESIEGLWRYDGKTFINFNAKDGMGKYSVWNMLEDSKGNIWIGTRNCGLYRYDGQTFVSFSE